MKLTGWVHDSHVHQQLIGAMLQLHFQTHCFFIFFEICSFQCVYANSHSTASCYNFLYRHVARARRQILMQLVSLHLVCDMRSASLQALTKE